MNDGHAFDEPTIQLKAWLAGVGYETNHARHVRELLALVSKLDAELAEVHAELDDLKVATAWEDWGQ